MTAFDSADLLLSFNEKAGRPTTDAITDARKYARLSKSQNRIVAMLSAVSPSSLYPKVGYSSIPTLTTSDNQVYTFGSDASGYAIFPMGKGGIFESLSDIPDSPLIPGFDYMVEGTQIRAPNNQTLPSTLYWYGISQPADISASTQPSLFPEASRELIVIDAVRQFATEGVRNGPLADEMTVEWERAWPQWCLVWKTQYRGGGALVSYTGMQLGLIGAYNSLTT